MPSIPYQNFSAGTARYVINYPISKDLIAETTQFRFLDKEEERAGKRIGNLNGEIAQVVDGD